MPLTATVSALLEVAEQMGRFPSRALPYVLAAEFENLQLTDLFT